MTLMLGLGNDLLADDAVGLRVASELSKDIVLRAAGVQVMQTTEMGLALLDLVTGYDDLIIVDAIQTGAAEPGAIHMIDGGGLACLPVVSPHFLGVGEMLALGRELGMHVPASVRIFAIEVADPYTVATTMTPALEQALPAIVRAVRDAIASWIAAGTNPAGLSDDRGRIAPSREHPPSFLKEGGASCA
jgi:hydrogenase maturation protease